MHTKMLLLSPPRRLPGTARRHARFARCAVKLACALSVLGPAAAIAEEPAGLSALFAAVEAGRPALVTPI